jgi:hypothetical protein
MERSTTGLVLQRIEYDERAWEAIVDGYPAADVYHSSGWLTYLKRSQGAQPVTAEVLSEGRVVGHYVGAMVRRFGVRILGSPMPGWGTQVMGFLLDDGVDRRAAADALLPFAYGELRCAHVELGDRLLTPDEMAGSRYVVSSWSSQTTVDVSGSDDDIVAQAHSRTRTYMRRGPRNGLHGEAGHGSEFADEYYDQLVDVFASSGLVPTVPRERVRQLIEALEPSGQVTLTRLVDADDNHLGTSICIGRNRRAMLWGLAFFRQYSRLHPVEPLQFETMKALRERGYTIYNMAGSEPSKAKFASAVEPLLLVRNSRFPALEAGRAIFRRTFYFQQRIRGRAAQRREAQAQHGQGPED